MREIPVSFKKEIRLEDRAPITLWLGDSIVWMRTAVRINNERGPIGVDSISDSNELNVAHVCVGLAIELVLKALAKSEGRKVRTTHKSRKNYQSLRRDSQARIAKIVERYTSGPTETFLRRMDDMMCHPDRKYWMVGPRGQQSPVSFGSDLIPDIAKIHAEIVDMVGHNSFDNWRAGMRPQMTSGPLAATVHFGQDRSFRVEITEAGKKMGITTDDPS